MILQAGQINTGAFDPFDELIPLVHEKHGWVHVDGAFGLWLAAVPELEARLAGVAHLQGGEPLGERLQAGALAPAVVAEEALPAEHARRHPLDDPHGQGSEDAEIGQVDTRGEHADLDVAQLPLHLQPVFLVEVIAARDRGDRRR